MVNFSLASAVIKNKWKNDYVKILICLTNSMRQLLISSFITRSADVGITQLTNIVYFRSLIVDLHNVIFSIYSFFCLLFKFSFRVHCRSIRSYSRLDNGSCYLILDKVARSLSNPTNPLLYTYSKPTAFDVVWNKKYHRKDAKLNIYKSVVRPMQTCETEE